MRRLLNSILLFLGMAAFVACGKEGSLSVISDSNLSFTQDGGRISVSFSSSGDWVVTTQDSWLSVSPSSGFASTEPLSFVLFCDYNDSYDPRTGTVTITSGSLFKTITVTQAEDIDLIVPETSLEVSKDAQIVSVKVQTNVPYTVLIDEDSKSWISQASTKGLAESAVSFSIARNDGEDRTGTIILEYEDLKEQVTIIQAGPSLIFTDAGFREYCLANFDENGDGEISQREASAVTTITLPEGSEIASLKGIEGFHQLLELRCSKLQLSSLDLSGCNSLMLLYCEGNRIKDLNVAGCPMLNTLDCRNNLLATLDLSACPKLTSLTCSGNQLQSINVSACTLLTNLQCGNNQLASLDVSGCSRLTSLGCDDNKLTSLKLDTCSSLDNLFCSYNQLSAIDLSPCPALRVFRCSNNQLTNLDLKDCPGLQELNCQWNMFESLDFSNNILLAYVDCSLNSELVEIWLITGQTIAEFHYDQDRVTIKYK